MAYNTNTGETTLNNRTYTPINNPTTRDAYRTIHAYAATPGFPTGHDRTALLIAIRRLYRLPAGDRNTFALARTVLRGIRAELAA